MDIAIGNRFPCPPSSDRANGHRYWKPVPLSTLFRQGKWTSLLETGSPVHPLQTEQINIAIGNRFPCPPSSDRANGHRYWKPVPLSTLFRQGKWTSLLETGSPVHPLQT